ncbi:MAG TPA: hypothetical protein VF555_21415 [Variovorax sp.]
MVMLGLPLLLGPVMNAETAVPDAWTSPPVITTVALPVPLKPADDARIPPPVPVFNTCPPDIVTWEPLDAVAVALADTVLAAPVEVSVPAPMFTVESPPLAVLVTVTAESVEVIDWTLVTLTASSGFTGPMID